MARAQARSAAGSFAAAAWCDTCSTSVDFPMPRGAADEHQRAGHDAAAKHAVELAKARGEPRRGGGLDGGDRQRR